MDARAVGPDQRRRRSCSRASAASTTPCAPSTPASPRISVSNHGGNNLDGTPAAIRMVKPIADAVGDQIEVVMDGGIRRGSDVVKAVALGARAVMIGRAYLWGLAANGQAGRRERPRRPARRHRLRPARPGRLLDPRPHARRTCWSRTASTARWASPTASSSRQPGLTVRLADATSPETTGAGLVLVPVGSIEQHGPHLPLETDTIIATAVATATAERWAVGRPGSGWRPR